MANEQTEKEAQRDARVLDLYEQLLEIEQRLIPVGLHVFGRPSSSPERVDLLRMIVAFDRPEAGARALPGLIAERLGLSTEGLSKEERLVQNERIQGLVVAALQEFLTNGTDSAVAFLQHHTGVAAEDSQPIFTLLERVSNNLESNTE